MVYILLRDKVIAHIFLKWGCELVKKPKTTDPEK